MSDDAAWQALRNVLQHAAESRKRVRLWLRDDDAVQPSTALDRLLDITRSHSIPLALAVIPAFTGDALAARLHAETHVETAVHGWAHRNHAADHEKKQELGDHRPQPLVLDELEAGLRKLQGLYPRQLAPVLVPPWNRIAASLLPHLQLLGYRVLSVYGPADTASPLRQVNTHVDLMDWHGTGGCRPHGELAGNLAAEIESRLAGNREPIGILTHHLVHDASAWRFMESLFENTVRHPAVEWCRLSALLA